MFISLSLYSCIFLGALMTFHTPPIIIDIFSQLDNVLIITDNKKGDKRGELFKDPL